MDQDRREEIVENSNNDAGSLWPYLPHLVLFHICGYLNYKELLKVGEVCRSWLAVSRDDLLWKDLFYRSFKVDRSVPIIAGKWWREEFKRLCYHIPIVQTETLTDHMDEVLHVSFSHNGKYFATCSKDGYIRVWDSTYPASIKYFRDMRTFCWKYTQYSQFNQSDTLLLVSGPVGTPHSGEIAVFSLQGFKRIKPFMFPKRMDPGPTLKERLVLQECKKEQLKSGSPPPEPNWLDFDAVADKFDKIDHLIDVHGYIIGMGLSPDHRYLYVNSRPWPQGYTITNPLDPPPIAQEIDIHVIDLVTLKQVGTMLRSHKAYTPNDGCFFIFLDVCNEYVASGAEDKHGYLWDRHYGICLAKFPHTDVVNSVAFNPKDPEMLVTTSDDNTIKIWRSRAKAKQLGLTAAQFQEGIEKRRYRMQRNSRI